MFITFRGDDRLRASRYSTDERRRFGGAIARVARSASEQRDARRVGWFLYGDGLATAEHPIVASHVIGQSPAVNLRAATRKQLVHVIADAVGVGATTKPDCVFLYVGDHGGLDGEAFAKAGFEPDPFAAPNVAHEAMLYGAGDADP